MKTNLLHLQKITDMKNIITIIISVLCLLSCSGKSKKITIKGDIDGLKNEMILVYGASKSGDALDTIFPKKGEFVYKATVDTLTEITFVFKNMEECVVFADKGDKIKIKGEASSIDQLEVSGNDFNGEMNDFRESISDILKSTKKIRKELYSSYASGNQAGYNSLLQSADWIKASKDIKDKATDFIKSHASSPVSVYLLNKYFIQESNPDYKKIKELIGLINGPVKDSPFIQQIIKSMNSKSALAEGKAAPYFNLPDSKKAYLSLSNYKSKYLLINFWASWSTASKNENSKLNAIYKRFNKNHLVFLGISLDTDKMRWQEAIKRDTLAGDQACDFNGWGSNVIQQYGVESLPANILIDPKGNIVARNLEEKDLIKKLEELFIEIKP